jgi:hypothetical protein
VAASDIWAVGYYTTTTGIDPNILILHWNGIHWDLEPGTVTGALYAISATTSGDVWAVGATQFNYLGLHPHTLAMRWDGSIWSRVASADPDPYSNLLYGVKAVTSNPDDVWAVGIAGPSSLTEHWDGQTWEAVSTPIPPYIINGLFAVDTIAPNDVWAVGLCCHDPQDPIAFHWDGTSWHDVVAPNPSHNNARFNTVLALDSNDVWAVGLANPYPGGSLIEHWDGTEWSVVPSPPSARYKVLNSIGAPTGTANDVWAVGYDGYGDGE